MFHISRVSLYFFALAFIDFFVGLFFFSFKSFNYSPFIFGFVFDALLGGLYQIVPNSFQKRLAAKNLSYLILFLKAVLTFSFIVENIILEKALLSIIGFLFFAHILSSFKKPVTFVQKFFLVGIFYLFLFSIFEIISFNYNLNEFFLLHTFLLGFMLNILMGTQLAIFPLLYMETPNYKLTKISFFAHQISVPLLLIGFYKLNFSYISKLSIFEIASIGIFIYTIYLLFESKKVPKRVPFTLQYFIVGLVFLVFGVSAGSFVAAKENLNFLFIHRDFMIFGFLAITIFGAMMHFASRILWALKLDFSQKISISDTIYEEFVSKALISGILSAFYIAFVDAFNIYYFALFYVVFLLFVFCILFCKEIKKFLWR